MADGLLNFDNLRSVLEGYGEAVAAQYKANLARDNRPTGADSLRNSIKTHVEVGENSYTVEMDLKDYWKWIEHGTKGRQTGNPTRKFPPVNVLLNWIQVKPVIPRPDSKGRIPKPESLAFLIGRKIREFGTEGKTSLGDAKETTWNEWRTRIEEALRADMYDYVRQIMTGG